MTDLPLLVLKTLALMVLISPLYFRGMKWFERGPLRFAGLLLVMLASQVYGLLDTHTRNSWHWVNAIAALWFSAFFAFQIWQWRTGRWTPGNSRPFKRWPKIERVMWGKVRKERKEDG